MGDVFKAASKYLLYVLFVALFIWTCSLTYQLAVMLFPGNTWLPWFCLALFDFATVTWFFTFVGHSKGIPQRAVAMIAFVLDLIGVMFMGFAGIYLSGQTLTEVPEGLGRYVVWAVGGYTMINLAAVYIHHITNPDVITEIEMQTLEDQIAAEAINQLKGKVAEQAGALAVVLQQRMFIKMLSKLALPISSDVTTTGTVIDVQAKDVPEETHTFESDTAGGTTTGTVTNPTKAGKRR